MVSSSVNMREIAKASSISSHADVTVAMRETSAPARTMGGEPDMTEGEAVLNDMPGIGMSHDIQAESGPLGAAKTPGALADEIIRSLTPRHVFDAGCGDGSLIEAFWDRGIEARGRDLSPGILSHVRPGIRSYCEAGSITAPFPAGQDLILCIEVLQHMPESEASDAIGAMTAAADHVLFASSPRDFSEPAPVNVRPVIHWLKLFGEAGFSPVLTYDASFLSPHAILFKRSENTPEARDLLTFAEIARHRLRAAEALRVAGAARTDAIQHIQTSDLEATRRIAAEQQRTRERTFSIRAEADQRIALAHRNASLKTAAMRTEADQRVETAKLETQREKIKAKAQLVAAQEQLMQVSKQLAESRRQLVTEGERHRRMNSDLRRQMDIVFASTSWRITRPLRVMMRLARREPAAVARVRALLKRPFRIAGRLARQEPEAWARVNEFLHTSVAKTSPVLNAAIADAVRLTAPPAIRSEPVDVVVCVHNAPDDVRRCLASVIACTMPPYRLIIVDDGSAAETADILTTFADAHGATLIRHQQAKGYTFAANAGLRASLSPWVVLLNSDTVVSESWLDRMTELGRRDARIGLIGPLSNTASWQSVPLVEQNGDWADNPLPEGTDVAAMARIVAGASARQGVPLPFLNGFCLMIRRELIDDIGLFDEAVFGAGYGEENDFCIRARKKGWRLMVADDTYVYHAQSRSYSHERRLELARRADEALARKHDPDTDIMPHVVVCRDGLGLAGVRARVAAAMERDRLIQAGRTAWEGKRVAFVLPISEAGGGANVVFQEARALHRMGVDCWIVNMADNRTRFEASYPGLDLPVAWMPDVASVPGMVADHLPRFDAIVATAWHSVFWLPPPGPHTRLGYYVQDFEPLFYDPGTREETQARESYHHRSDVRMFTKTDWNADRVAAVGAPRPAVVGSSVDIDLFRPAPQKGMDNARVVHVCAMIRPSSPRRAPGMTLKIMKHLHDRFGSRVRLTTFGASAEECAAFGFSMEGINHLGAVRPAQMAALLENADVFLDFSEWQAMGLTTLEAMASGCAVIAPRRGGAITFARDGETALVCDTDDPDACQDAAIRLVVDDALRGQLQHAAIDEAILYAPERAALAMLDALFKDDREDRPA